MKTNILAVIVLSFLAGLFNGAHGQYLVVKKKNAKIRTVPSINGNVLEEVPKGTVLIILEEASSSSNNYHKVNCTTLDAQGWVVMTSVKKVREEIPDALFSDYTYAYNLFGIGQVPIGYYKKAEALQAEELKSELHKIIRNHKVLDYDEVYRALTLSDQDPLDTMHVVLFYTSRTQPRLHRDRGGRYDYKQNGYVYKDAWNREHIWPKSLGFPNERDTAYTDLHHIRPADRTINTERNTRAFGYGTIPYYDNDGSVRTECFTSEEWLWEPPDRVKGDVARMVLYMDVRYQGYPLNGVRVQDLEVVDEVLPKGSREPMLGNLRVLLEWHRMDPVDNWERRRNDIIYKKFQGNRNPFIDHPEFVERIWEQKNEGSE